MPRDMYLNPGLNAAIRDYRDNISTISLEAVQRYVRTYSYKFVDYLINYDDQFDLPEVLPVDCSTMSTLYWALAHQRLDIVDELLISEADINITPANTLFTPFLLALHFQNFQLVEKMLQIGVSLEPSFISASDSPRLFERPVLHFKLNLIKILNDLLQNSQSLAISTACENILDQCIKIEMINNKKDLFAIAAHNNCLILLPTFLKYYNSEQDVARAIAATITSNSCSVQMLRFLSCYTVDFARILNTFRGPIFDTNYSIVDDVNLLNKLVKLILTSTNEEQNQRLFGCVEFIVAKGASLRETFMQMCARDEINEFEFLMRKLAELKINLTELDCFELYLINKNTLNFPGLNHNNIAGFLLQKLQLTERQFVARNAAAYITQRVLHRLGTLESLVPLLLEQDDIKYLDKCVNAIDLNGCKLTDYLNDNFDVEKCVAFIGKLLNLGYKFDNNSRFLCVLTLDTDKITLMLIERKVIGVEEIQQIFNFAVVDKFPDACMRVIAAVLKLNPEMYEALSKKHNFTKSRLPGIAARHGSIDLLKRLIKDGEGEKDKHNVLNNELIISAFSHKNDDSIKAIQQIKAQSLKTLIGVAYVEDKKHLIDPKYTLEVFEKYALKDFVTELTLKHYRSAAFTLGYLDCNNLGTLEDLAETLLNIDDVKDLTNILDKIVTNKFDRSLQNIIKTLEFLNSLNPEPVDPDVAQLHVAQQQLAQQPLLPLLHIPAQRPQRFYLVNGESYPARIVSRTKNIFNSILIEEDDDSDDEIEEVQVVQAAKLLEQATEAYNPHAIRNIINYMQRQNVAVERRDNISVQNGALETAVKMSCNPSHRNNLENAALFQSVYMLAVKGFASIPQQHGYRYLDLCFQIKQFAYLMYVQFNRNHMVKPQQVIPQHAMRKICEYAFEAYMVDNKNEPIISPRERMILNSWNTLTKRSSLIVQSSTTAALDSGQTTPSLNSGQTTPDIVKRLKAL